MGRIIVRPAAGEKLLTEKALSELASLDSLVREEVSVDGGLKFADLCATFNGECWRNDILNLSPHGADIESGETLLTYPVWFDPFTFSRVVFPFFAGGIVENENHTIDEIEALALNYFIKSDTDEDKEM